MRNVTDMSDREFFAQFARRTGMYVTPTTFSTVTAFMAGYDQAARRCGGPGLGGWQEWLVAGHGAAANLFWGAQIRQLALPDDRPGAELGPEQDAHALRVLFELLDQFLAEREDSPPSRP